VASNDSLFLFASCRPAEYLSPLLLLLLAALYITIIACIPIFFFSWYAGDILAALGQPKDVAELTTQYVPLLHTQIAFVIRLR